MWDFFVGGDTDINGQLCKLMRSNAAVAAGTPEAEEGPIDRRR